MDAINILWQVGILSAVLIFGIKLGLATGLANMSKRYLDNLPDEMKPQIKKSNAKESVFYNENGTGLKGVINCMTAGNTTVGRSDTFQNLHVSEYAFWGGKK